MALRRSSDWSIVWAPATAGVLTLLSLDDAMAEEILTGEFGAHNVGVLDGARGARPVARGGAVRRLEFSRVDEHASLVAAWRAQAEAMAADPWGTTSVLEIQPRGSSARQMRAALLSTSHKIALVDGAIETIHTYKFRISRNTL